MRLGTIGMLGAAVVAAMAASGCVVGEDGHMIVRYEFKNTVGPEGFTCAQVGIAKVEVTVKNVDTGEQFAPIVANCLDGDQRLVHIINLSLGRYDVVVRFLDALNQEVARADDLFNPTDPQPNQVKCEGDVAECRADTVYSVNSTGDFDFTIDYAAPGGMNCSPAGVSMSVQQSLLVSNSAGAPITLRLVIPQVTPGPPEGKQYQPNQTEMCIENGVTETMLNHFIGFYTMQAKGLAISTPPLTCYDSLPLPFRITSVKGARTVFTAPITPEGMGKPPCNAT